MQPAGRAQCWQLSRLVLGDAVGKTAQACPCSRGCMLQLTHEPEGKQRLWVAALSPVLLPPLCFSGCWLAACLQRG